MMVLNALRLTFINGRREKLAKVCKIYSIFPVWLLKLIHNINIPYFYNCAPDGVSKLMTDPTHSPPNNPTTNNTTLKFTATEAVVVIVLLSLLFIPAKFVAHVFFLSALCFVASGTIISILHAWVTDLDPIQTMVSEYALNKTRGPWMNAAFFLIGGGAISLGSALWHCGDMNRAIAAILTIAGSAAAALGIFSMQSLLKEEIPSSAYSGRLHGICVLISFTLAIISMLTFACSELKEVGTEQFWLRGVALVHFNFAGLSALFFGILGLNMVRKVQIHTSQHAVGVGLSALTVGTVRLKSSIDAAVNTQQSGDAKTVDSGAIVATVHQAKRGLGLLERILIFMFIEWGIFLSIIEIIRHPIF